MNGARLKLLNNNARLGARLFSKFLCGSLYRTGDGIGSQVVDHVAEPCQGYKLALRQFAVKALRLTADIRNLIISTGDDRDWHPQLAVVVLQLHHCGRHEGCVLSRGA